MSNLPNTLFRLAKKDGGENLVNDIKLASFNVVELLIRRLRRLSYDKMALKSHNAELEQLLVRAKKLEPVLEQQLPATTEKAAIRIVECIL